MAKERIYSKSTVDLGILPGWTTNDLWESVPVVEAPTSEIHQVAVRPYLDITFNTGGNAEGVGFHVGATLEEPLPGHNSVEADLSRTGPLPLFEDYSGCNRMIKEIRRARNADNGAPE